MGGPSDRGESSQAATLDMDRCLACGTPALPPFCAACGFFLEEQTSVLWPAIGQSLVDAPQIIIRAPLPSARGTARFLAADTDGKRFEVICTAKSDPGSVRAGRERSRALLGDIVLPVTTQVSTPEWDAEVVALPDMPSLTEALASVLAKRDETDAVELVHHWILPLVDRVAELHDRGLFFGMLDPAEVLIGGGDCVFRSPPVVRRIEEGAWPPGLRRSVRGFSSPEVHGQCGGEVGPRSDVFFIGIMLYYLLARIPPLAEVSQPHERLPPPSVYHPDVPPELLAVARRAVSGQPTRRYADAIQMREALVQALAVNEARLVDVDRSLQVDIGHEIHIGVLKGQYSPVNQDDLFLAYHGETAIGLFVVTDGVSISTHGTGDMASGCVRQAALATWRKIADGQFAQDGRRGPALPQQIEARAQMVRDMLDDANAQIGRLIHQEQPRFEGPPEGIMAATAVTVVLEGNRMLLSSIGDSRAYLIRDGHIAQLMVDHNLNSQLLRMGRSPTAARAATASNALIRCVGEFRKGADAQLVPVPLQPDFKQMNVLPGDTLVICSDGIPDYGGRDEEDAEANIRHVVENAPGSPWAAFDLMVLANRGGGGDNISCVVLRFFDGAS